MEWGEVGCQSSEEQELRSGKNWEEWKVQHPGRGRLLPWENCTEQVQPVPQVGRGGALAKKKDWLYLPSKEVREPRSWPKGSLGGSKICLFLCIPQVSWKTA